jgi:hypothetical protein
MKALAAVRSRLAIRQNLVQTGYNSDLDAVLFNEVSHGREITAVVNILPVIVAVIHTMLQICICSTNDRLSEVVEAI